MADHSGFIDLRIGQATRGIGDDSVWPSFTDIMTVIVMVFLMALVIMVVRNFELDRQLVTTVTASEAASLENRGLLDRLGRLQVALQGAQSSLDVSEVERGNLRAQLIAELTRIESLLADKVSLESQLVEIIRQRTRLAKQQQEFREALTAARSEAADTRQRLTDITASEAELAGKVAALSAQLSEWKIQSAGEIETLSGVNLSLSTRLDEAATQLREVSALLRAEQKQRRELDTKVAAQAGELLAKQALLVQLQQVQLEATSRTADADAEIVKLTTQIRRRQAENEALRREADASEVQHRTLREEYESLNAEFRDLVRPARSSAGKVVVVVRILRTDTGIRFQLQAPGQANENLDRETLAQRLDAMKTAHGGDLYTKVIIPENSELSHDDAWRLTWEILRNYDYYYQP